MPRGQKAAEGDTRVAPNGYHYTKQNGKWRLTHHIVMEKIIMRPLREDERVEFKSKDKLNFDPENLHLTKQGRGSLRRRRAALQERIRELQTELEDVEKQLLA